jgi:hypothetical protein
MSNASTPTETRSYPDTVVLPPMAPLLTFPLRTPTPLLTELTITPAFIQRTMQEARWHKQRLHAAIHVAMVAQVPRALNVQLVEAIRVFARRTPSPPPLSNWPFTTVPRGEVLIHTLSPPPLPVRPHPDTPFPTDII